MSNEKISIKRIVDFFASNEIFEASIENGTILTFDELASIVKLPKFEIKKIVDSRILQVNFEIGIPYKQKKLYIVKLGENECGLDCEEVVRTCLRRWFLNHDYDAIGSPNREVKHEERVIDRVCSAVNNSNSLLSRSLAKTDYFSNRGIDLVTQPRENPNSEIWIIEIKGRVKHEFSKRDFYELLFQIADRILKVYKSCTEKSTFDKFRFGCVLPHFSNGLFGAESYEHELKLVSEVFASKQPKLLFDEAPYDAQFFRKNGQGISKMDQLKQITNGTPNILDMMGDPSSTLSLLKIKAM